MEFRSCLPSRCGDDRGPNPAKRLCGSLSRVCDPPLGCQVQIAWACAVRWHALFPTLVGRTVQVCLARNPKDSPLWGCLDAHFAAFLEIYPQAIYSEVYKRNDRSFLHPIIPEVVEMFMGCRHFTKDFARVRCDHCPREICFRSPARADGSVPPATRRRCISSACCWPRPYWCPCRTGICALRPRSYFRFHRGLIKGPCRIAHACLAEFQCNTLGMLEGTTGVVMPSTYSSNPSTSTRTSTCWRSTGSSRRAVFSL